MAAHNWVWAGLLVVFSQAAGGVARADLLGYAGGAATPGLYKVDEATGSATFVTSVQPTLATGGLARLGTTYYATNYSPDIGSTPPNRYGTLDTTNGAFTIVGTQTGDWEGLTANQAGGFLYAIEINSSMLLKVVPGGSITPVGTSTGSNPQGLRGLAYDNVHDILYATDYYEGSPNLYTLNTATGAATLVGSLGLPPASAGGNIPLAYDDVHQVLYAANDVTSTLMSLNVVTGQATTIGPTGGVPIGSLAWSVPEPSGCCALVPLAGILGWRLRRRPECEAGAA